MTVRLSTGVHTLSVAPTRNGGFCEQWSGLVGGCTRDRTAPRSLPSPRGDINSFALGAGFQADEEGTVSLVSGRILDSGIERLTLEYADGQETEIPVVWVSPPIDAGFYLFEIPAEHRRPGHRATALVATGGDGKLVARQTFPVPRPEDIDRTATLPDGRVTQLPANALPEQARRLIDFRAENGVRITLWRVPRADGPPCLVHNSGRSCPPAGFLERFDIPLGAGLHGGRPVLFSGHVGRDVAQVELHYEDGAVELIEPVEHYVLAEIGSEHYGRGHRLVRAVALAGDGRVLERKAFRPDTHSVYPCEKPRDMGHGVIACP
jgi:hypothetical protein